MNLGNAIVIDGNFFVDRKSTHAYISKRLSFPDYYGGNLDALHDCLTDMEEITIVLYAFDIAKQNLGSYADSIKRVFIESAEENPNLSILFDEK